LSKSTAFTVLGLSLLIADLAQATEEPAKPVLEPTFTMASYSGLYDSSTVKGIGFAAGEARLGTWLRYREWQSRVELEALGSNDDTSLNNTVRVRELFLERQASFGNLRLGRSMGGGARRWGSWSAQVLPDETYGATDGLSYRLATDVSGLAANVSLTLANSIGSNPGASMRAYGDVYPNLFDTAAAESPKEGNALIANSSLQYGSYNLNIWFGFEKNRFLSAPSATSQPSAPDGEVAKRYEDLQISLGYNEAQWSGGIWTRKTLASEVLKATKTDDGRTVTAAQTMGGRVRTEWGAGVESRWSESKEADTWFSGLAYQIARTATDGLTVTQQQKEDNQDVGVVTLTHGWREGIFEISGNVMHAKAQGPIFNDGSDSDSPKDRRISFFLRAALTLTSGL
jgi:hypothetical protein